MGFYTVTGVMGGGKTMFCVEVIHQAMSEGAVCHTNIALNASILESKGWSDLYVKLPENPHEWRPMLRKGKEGAENLLVVDEASLTFHVHKQQKNRDANEEIFELLVWSRRAGLDVYFAAQSAANLDAQLRRLTEIRYHCTQVKMIPFVGRWLRHVVGDFMRTRYAGGEGKTRIGTTYHRFRKDIAEFYNTHDLHGRELGIQEGGATRKKKSDKDAKTFGCLMLFLLVALVFGAYRFYGLFWGREPEQAPSAESPAAVQADASSKQSAAGPAPFGPRTFTVAVSGNVMEWTIDASDDLLITAEMQEPLRLFIRGGGVVQLGRAYEGDLVESIVSAHQRHYILCASGRKLVARKPTRKEQAEWKVISSTRRGSWPSASQWGPASVSGSN